MILARKRAVAGFTLIELIVVVAIIAILAAIAIPVYRGYVLRSKASEVYNIVQGIREREEAYYSEYKRYTDAVPGAGNHTPYACGPAPTPGSTVSWIPLPAAWINLGFTPDGPTYYAYGVVTSYNGGVFNGGLFPGGIPGSTAFANDARPWFFVEGCGDIDNDGVVAYFYVSCFNKTVIKTRGPQPNPPVDDSVY